jgi:hypothetical protein
VTALRVGARFGGADASWLTTTVGGVVDEPKFVMPHHRVIKFLVGDRTLGRWSYGWRMGAGGTSFYIKPLVAWAQEIKVSLHGPDPARGLRGGYKLELDASARGAVDAVAEVGQMKNNWPDRQWFPGARVTDDVDLVMRLRFPWDLFTRDSHPVQAPADPRAREFGGLIAVPQPDYAVDVEVPVCKTKPWWPNERQARIDNACLGPVLNKAGQYLTAVVVHREIAGEPSPLVQHQPAGQVGGPPQFDRVRGLGAQLDDRGFLWIHEMWISQSALQAARLTAFRPG